MVECQECKGQMNPSNWKFCSIGCRNKCVSRAKRGNYRRTYMICHTCGSRYIVRNSQVNRSKFCSKKCKKPEKRKKDP